MGIHGLRSAIVSGWRAVIRWSAGRWKFSFGSFSTSEAVLRSSLAARGGGRICFDLFILVDLVAVLGGI
ncbi:hypothetical protein Taro_049542 [Colocasia esculenta]|uniref:Uncharacterized protein n=1 Tax=Colocasia esculenta TaxID=4460 RepID=A0A843XBA7_COLES|nr:hypothetical protein [Colocasia esculenta]